MPRGAGFTDVLQEERLISLVQERPVLWDKKNRQHKNSYKLRDAWDEIIDELNLGKNTVKNKWKSLLKTFKVEVSKANGVRSGSAANHGRKWIHFDSMQFLLDSVTPNACTGNLDGLFPDPDNESLSSDSDLLEYKENQDNLDVLLEEVNSSMFPKKTVSKTSKEDLIQNDKILKKALKEKNEAVIDPNDDMLYFKTLVSYIKTLEPHDRLSLRRDIGDLVEKYVYTQHEKRAHQLQQQKSNSPAARKTKRLEQEDNDSDVEIISVNIPDDKRKIKKIKEEKTFQYLMPNQQLQNSCAGYAPIHYPVAPLSLGHFPYAAPDGSQWWLPHHSNMPPFSMNSNMLQLPSHSNVHNTVTAAPEKFTENAPQRPQFPPPQETITQQVPFNATPTMPGVTMPEMEKDLNFSGQEESEQNGQQNTEENLTAL